ncbi:hypothetical protein V6N12_016956 [Hibiscus sabdariffa]|uniref:F-box associated beta-propeller type 1 domain-containing protein n=1 Tax=Hibiscus sabdariffa TaxID=183260 RepID=A0ABR2ATL5_9ROSI
MQGSSKTRVELPEMSVLDILSKLPVKFLTRFKEFRILPQSSIQRPTSLDYIVDTSLDCVGFCYDSQTDDYKVLRFVTNSFSYDYYGGIYYTGQVDLYSLKGNSWKEISDPGVNVQPSAEFDVYVDRFCYWLSFDMDNERFSTLPLSEFDVGLEQHNLLPLNYNGLLGGIYYPREGTLKSFDLWIMSRSWTKQFNIESVSGVERLLGFWKNGELFLESSDDELVLFDPSTRELKNLGIHSYMRKNANDFLC